MTLSELFRRSARWTFTPFFIFITFGCTGPTVEYQLDQFDDLVVSNSEQLNKKAQSLGNDDAELTYRLLIANRSSSKTYTLDTQQAAFSIGKQESVKASCTPSEKVTLVPGTTAKITCSTIVHGFTEDDQRDRTCKITLDYQKVGEPTVGRIAQDCRLKVRVRL